MAGPISKKDIEDLISFANNMSKVKGATDDYYISQKKVADLQEDLNELTNTYSKQVNTLRKKEVTAAAILAKKEEQRSKTVKKKVAATKKYIQLTKGLTKEERDNIEVQAKGTKSIKDANREYQKTRKEVGRIQKVFDPSVMGKRLQSIFKGAVDKKGIGSGFRYIQDQIRILKRFERKNGVDIIDVKSMRRSAAALEMSKYFDDAINKPIEEMGDKARDELIDSFKKAGNDISKQKKILGKMKDLESILPLAGEKKKHIEDVSGMRGGSFHKRAEMITDAGSNVVGAGKALLKGDQRGLSSAADQMRAISVASKGMGGALGGIGKGLGFLGNGLAALGKLNWIFALIGAVKAMISAVNELDKFMKALNQTFLELAGPSVGMGNVREEMGRFNKEVFNLGRNMKLGLKGEEIQGLFKAMSGSGMSLQGVMKRIGSYGEAIEKARTMSLQFGVSFDKMGGEMTSQMIDLNSSLDDVAKNFNKLAFDASKAGISSDKFYQAVEASAMSLSFYGNNIKYVSGLLGDFFKTGNLAFKDAAKVTDTFATAFENMDENARRKFIILAGPEAMAKAYEGVIVDAEKKRKSLEAEAIKDPARRKEIQEQIDVTDALIMQLKRAKGGPLGEQQLSFPYLIKHTMPLMMAAMKNKTSITGEKMSLTTFVKSLIPNLDQNTILKGLVEQVDLATVKYKQLDTELTENIRNNSKYGTEIKGIIEEYAKGDSGKYPDFSVIEDRLTGLIKAAAPGASEDEISRLINAVKDNPSVILKGLLGDRTELLNDFVSYMGTLNKGDANLSEKGRKELIGSITPLEKFAEITKDYLKFQVGDKLLSGILAATAQSASYLGNLVEAGEAKKVKRREEAKKAVFAAGDMPGKISELVKKMMAMEDAGTQLDKDGNITKEYEDVQNDLKKITADKVTGALRENYASNVRAEQMYIKDFYERKWDLEGKAKKAQTDYEKQEIKKKQEEMIKEWDSRKTAKGTLDENVDPSELEKAKWDVKINPLTHTLHDGSVKDAKAMSGGWKKLSKGDLVVHNKELAKTMNSRYGGLADRVAGTMKPLAAPASGAAMTNQNNWGGVNINFNAPADASNPAAYRNMFVDAVEQIFDRKMYAEKSKGKGR